MKIATVIPAFNEEQTVGSVVEIVRSVPELAEVIVVCDGCTDDTAKAARQAGAKVIMLPENRGKGAAMLIGAAHTSAEVIIFVDADLIGLKQTHLLDLVHPVLVGEADMTVGIFARGRLATDLAQFIAPYLSGQRAMRKQLLNWIDNMEVARYGIEAG
ncbi:MAG: glycosyltransferase family 2 protein, partial [Firmicutes bacterium]|nr:glycosyltransferase family 2 protein [Bacillota bacterium]